MATQTRQMCAQEESGVGMAFIRCTYDDVSQSILTVEYQNTTSRSCYVEIQRPDGSAVISQTMASGLAFHSLDISGLGLLMVQRTGAHGRVAWTPPFGCYLRWPA